MLFLIIFLMLFVLFIIFLVTKLIKVLRNGSRYLCDDVDGAVRGQLAMFETSKDIERMRQKVIKPKSKF